MDNLFQNDNPPNLHKEASNPDFQVRFTPRDLYPAVADKRLADLPTVHISDEKPMRAGETAAIARDVISNLEHDCKYGSASEHGQISVSDGLIQSITFPNHSEQALQLNYDDHRVSSLQMNGQLVNFNYDGPNLSQVSFSGTPEREPINLMPYDYPKVAFMGNRQLPAEPAVLAAEISDYLKK